MGEHLLDALLVGLGATLARLLFLPAIVPDEGDTPTVRVPTPLAPPVPVIVPRAPAVIPSTTIVTTHGDGTITTVTRQASAYELGPVIVAPVDPAHRVGPSPHVNPYVYRPR